MNFETFMESIKNHIKEYLPESYQDAQVTIREQQKLNNRYMGLTVIRPGDDRIPTINLTDLYRQYYENPKFVSRTYLSRYRRSSRKNRSALM